MKTKEECQEIFNQIAIKSFRIIDSQVIDFRERQQEADKLAYLIDFAEMICLNVGKEKKDNYNKTKDLFESKLSPHIKELKDRLTK